MSDNIKKEKIHWITSNMKNFERKFDENRNEIERKYLNEKN